MKNLVLIAASAIALSGCASVLKDAGYVHQSDIPAPQPPVIIKQSAFESLENLAATCGEFKSVNFSQDNLLVKFDCKEIQPSDKAAADKFAAVFGD